MTFKEPDQVLAADPRFAALAVSDEHGVRAICLLDHHRAIATVDLVNDVPSNVRAAFDRARNVLLYAYFAYDLLVVGEAQALAAFELALKHRLTSNSVRGGTTLRNLIDRGRKQSILPPLETSSRGLVDHLEALLRIRNELAHGTADIHSPGMALHVLRKSCAREIDRLFPKCPTR